MHDRDKPTQDAEETTGDALTHATPLDPKRDPAEEIIEKGEPVPGNFA